MNQETAKTLMKKVVKDYSKISSEFDRTRQKSWKEFDNYLKFIKEKDKVLDIGCGNGRFYQFLKENKKVDYIGMDNNKDLLEHAKSSNPEAKFKEGDLLKIPAQDNQFDIEVCIAALHHIPTEKLKKKAIKEAHRVLKNKGIYIVSVWNLFQKKYKKYIWESRKKSISSFGKYESRDTMIPWGKSGVKRYYYAFKLKELSKLLEEGGFKILENHKGNNFVIICQKS
jgi:tRNA (uracil-5-)-methyltransferase TRM9